MKVQENSPMDTCPCPSSPRFSAVSRVALLMALAGGPLSAPCAFAQDDTSLVKGDEAIEEIVVTGSRIMRRDFVTPSPVTTLDRDDINFSGQSTIEETLNQMPQVFPSFGRTSNNPVLTAEARQVFTDNYACAPDTACFVMGRRMLEMGPRIIESERDTLRLVTGVKGEFGDGWSYDGWVMYTEAKATEYWRNVISISRLQQGLLVDPLTNACYDQSDGCVPLNLFGEGNLSQEGAKFIRLPDFENVWERTQKLASFFVSGSPVDTWAGALDIALGVEWRSDAFEDNPDPDVYSNDALGFNVYAPSIGTEEVAEIYAEAVVPLLSGNARAEYLGLEIGARSCSARRTRDFTRNWKTFSNCGSGSRGSVCAAGYSSEIFASLRSISAISRSIFFSSVSISAAAASAASGLFLSSASSLHTLIRSWAASSFSRSFVTDAASSALSNTSASVDAPVPTASVSASTSGMKRSLASKFRVFMKLGETISWRGTS